MKEIVAIGSIALDDVETPYGKRENAVGGSLIYFSYAASIFSEVALVGVAGKDFPEEVLRDLEKRGCDLAGVEIKEGASFRWAGIYKRGKEDPETLRTQLGLFGEFQPNPPADYRRAKILYLGNLSPSLQASLLEEIEHEIAAMDTMNHWIESHRNELLSLLKRINILFVNRSEAEMLSGESGSVPACHRLMEMGPGVVVVKRGEAGALLCSPRGTAALPAFPVRRVVDPTGAGDSFAGGFLGTLARGQSLPRALAVAIAVSSFTVEAFSVDRLARVNRRDVEERLEGLKKLVEF